MFDPQIPYIGSHDAQQALAAKGVIAACEAGTFTYTEMLSWRQPVPTLGFCALDGVRVQNGIPQYNQDPAEEWDGKPLILVHKDPGGSIMGYVKRRVPGFGGKRGKVEEIMHDYGNFAAIPDQLPDRAARMLLVQKGWPIIENLDVESGRNGEYIEWRWLKKEALSANPAEGIPELYNEILGRRGFRELLAKHGETEDAPESVPMTMSKTPGRKSQAGANP